MENILLYPTITSSMLENSGTTTDKFHFSYSYQGQLFGLQQKGVSTIKLTDPLEIWKVESEGLILEKTVRIAYPALLKGKGGVVCEGAELGICIIWTNKKLTQTGYILPSSDITTPQGRVCKFNTVFAPGTLSGDLDLSISFYLKKKSESVKPGEEDFVNEDGVTVGEIEHVVIDFSSLYMEFPIEEYNSASEPLWWVEFSEWEDPRTVDLFSKDSLCLYLNPHYDSCPSPSTSEAGNSIKNLDMLVDILSQTYLLIFQRLSDEELKATKLDIGLAQNSICSVLHQFIVSCPEELSWESPQKLLKSLQVNIRKLLQGGQ